jgi:hypothetical protein
MANPVGAVSHVPPVAPAHETQAETPAANVTKVAPQDTVNIRAAGKAASQAKPAAKPAEGAKHGGLDTQANLSAIGSNRLRFGAPSQRPRNSGRGCVSRGSSSALDLAEN